MLGRVTSGLGIGGAYGATLERIQGQGGDRGKFGMEAIMWVSRSERPLTAEELCHALGIEEDSTELDPENVPAMETILSCCLGLVTVDEGGSRVRLIHLTLQEYLSGHPNLFGSAHSKMADVCLTYLNFQSIKDLPSNLLKPPKAAPFLDYASCYWGAHARKDLTERTKTLALQLLDRYDSHVSSRILQVNQIWAHYHLQSSWGGFTGLHAIACFGVAEIATALIKLGGWEVDMPDSSSYTPLWWAVRNNNREVCEILLELGGADPNIRDDRGRTPLLIASVAGHEDIVKLLLERKEVDLDPSDKDGQTALRVAVEGGHGDIVKLLLDRKEVNPDSCDKDGRTPLWGAASWGHEGMVKLFVERKDVNPNSSDKYGITPLFEAAVRGHEGIVKLLLQHKEVNPGSFGEDGRTPLSEAAKNGHEGIVKLLLERKEVYPNPSSEGGQTPLSWAAQGGHEGIVKLLLERQEVNPDSPDKSGKTPLSGAALGGHEGIVKLLLERKEVNPGSSDMCGQTPLLWATLGGHEGIVKLLLERKEVNPDPRDKHGQTPLFGAARNGYEGIVKLLLERGEVNPNSSDTKARTLLSRATEYVYKDAARLLQEQISAYSKPPEASDKGTRSPATRRPHTAPAQVTIPGPLNKGNLKPQSHPQKGVSVNPSHISYNDHDTAMNTPVNRKYFRLACASLVLLLCLIPPLDLKRCLIFGLFIFLPVSF